jgi:hypothetical protein
MTPQKNAIEEFEKIRNQLKETLDQIYQLHRENVERFFNWAGLKNIIPDIRPNTLLNLAIAFETAIDLIEYNLPLNKFENLGYKIRYVLLTQPHFALDNLFTHICDFEQVDSFGEKEKKSKKQQGFVQKFKELKGKIPELSLVTEQIDLYTRARNSLHGNYVHRDKSTDKDQYVVLQFEEMKTFLSEVIMCVMIIYEHLKNEAFIPDMAVNAFCHNELEQLGFIDDKQVRYNFDLNKLKESGKETIIAIASNPSIAEIEKNGIDKIQAPICVAAVKLKYKDLPLFMRELTISKNATKENLEKLRYYLTGYEKIYLVTEEGRVEKANTKEATVDADRKAMAECNNVLHGRRDFIDKILAEQEDNKESLAAIEKRPLFSISKDEIVLTEEAQTFADVGGVLNVENGKSKSLALSIAYAMVR